MKRRLRITVEWGRNDEPEAQPEEKDAGSLSSRAPRSAAGFRAPSATRPTRRRRPAPGTMPVTHNDQESPS